VLLLLGYGVGMAGTLTAAGLLLVKLRDRLDRVATLRRWQPRLARVAAWLPVGTATLVLLVGVGLALRAATGGSL
jgi:cytochrome c biogenesis protein CcdA